MTEDKLRILLVNPFDKIPGEEFRDQRYTILFMKLQKKHEVKWISSDFNHWLHKKRNPQMIPDTFRNKIVLIPTIPYYNNISIKRYISHLFLSLNTYFYIKKLKIKPDIILCVGPVELNYLISKYSNRNNIRLIIDILDLWPDLFFNIIPKYLSFFKKIISLPFIKISELSLKYAHEVTAVSRTYMEWAIKRSGRSDFENFSFFYLGNNSYLKSYNINKNRILLRCLFAGQFGFNYDIETIVEVAIRFNKEEINDIEFILAGDGYKKKKMLNLIRGLKNIKILNWINYKKLQRIGYHCHIGLNCYIKNATQSVPTKLFDYMSMGLFILNSLRGEASELIYNYEIGVNYEAENTDSLYICLNNLRTNIDSVIEGGKKSLEIFKRNFTLELVSQKMISELILKKM